MKRKIKQGSTLYAYLDKLGLLEHGTEAEIALAKKKYWSSYKRAWRKEMRKRCKAVILYFEQHEFKTIRLAAQRHKSSPARLIKVAALTSATNPVLITPAVVGKVRELLYKHYNALEQLCEKRNINSSMQEELLSQAIQLETKVLSLLSSP